MTWLPVKTIDVVAATTGVGFALLHQSRPAIAGACSYLAVALAVPRRALAFVTACVVVLGLIAVSDYATESAAYSRPHARASR